MIKEIHRIIVIDNEGNVFYHRENYIQGVGRIDYALLTKFVKALQSFATELGEEETRVIELGDEKIFSVKDNFTGFYFILNCDFNSRPKKMFKILNDIKNIFIDNFMGNLTSPEEIKKLIMNSFDKDVNKILEPTSKLEDFFKS